MATVTLTTSQKRSLTRAIGTLNRVREEIQADNLDFDIGWYLEDCSNLNLMEGNSHDERGNARRDRVIQHYYLERSSGGGW